MKQARDEAERLGLEFTAAALRTKGLVKFLSEVMKKTKGSSTSLTQLFGNVRALTGVMGLAGKSAIGFAYDLELMKNASGASTEAFKKQIVTSDAQIKMFNETVNKWAINFYAGFVRNFEMSSEAMDEWNRKVAIQNKQMDKTGDVLGLIITKGFQYHPLLQSISALTKDQATAEVQLEEAIRKKNEQISIFVTGFSPMANAVGIAINIYGQLMSQIVESNLPIGQQLDLLAKLRKEYFKLPPPVDKVTEAFEALKMKMKTELKGELLTLIENFDLVRGSGEATEKGIVTLAKKIVKLGNEVKVKLRPEFYRLAAVTKEVKESMAKLEEVMTPVKRVFDSVKLTLLEFTGYLDPKLKQALYITEKGFESLGVRVKLDFIDIIHQAKPALESAIWSGQGFERGMKVITTKVSSYWKRVVSDMARAFETAFTSMLDEAKSFADAFNALIRGMLSVFATVMGKIVSEWVTSFGQMQN